MAERKLAVIITGDAKGAKGAFRDVEKASDGMAGKLRSSGETVGKVFKATALGVGAVAVGVGAFVKGGIDALVELERIGAQTTAVIKSTGGAAGVSAEQVAKFAGHLEKTTGVEQEVIQKGQNMLLTFTNIRNGVGKNNDIFNQATTIMTDMSVAMGTDASKTAVQLGKALNDPIKGISALSKVGVTFNDQQKAQIKSMVEAGNVAGAQKVILAELKKEFGGSAEAFGDTNAGKIAKLKNLFGDFQETVAAKVLPVLTALTAWLSDKIPQAAALVQAKLDEWAPMFDRIAAAVGSFVASLGPVVEKIGQFIAANPTPVFAALATVVGGALLAGVVALGAAIGGLLSPFVLIVGAVAAVAAGLVYAYQHFEGFRNVVDGVASWLTGTAWPAIQAFAGLVMDGFGALVDYVKEIWPQVSEAIGHVVSVVQGVISNFVGVVRTVWSQWGDEIMAVIRLAWGYISSTVGNAIKMVQGVIQTVLAVINGDWGKAWDGIKKVFSAVWDQIRNIAGTALGLLKTALSAAWDGIKSAASGAWGLIKGVITGAIDGAKNWVKDRLSDLVGLLGGLPGRISAKTSGMFDGIRDAFKAALNWIIKKWNGLEFKLPAVEAFGVKVGGTTVGTPNIPELAKGGRVKAGMPYIVGDGGVPEVFVPDQAGTVVPSLAQFGAAATTRSVSYTQDTSRVIGLLNSTATGVAKTAKATAVTQTLTDVGLVTQKDMGDKSLGLLNAIHEVSKASLTALRSIDGHIVAAIGKGDAGGSPSAAAATAATAAVNAVLTGTPGGGTAVGGGTFGTMRPPRAGNGSQIIRVQDPGQGSQIIRSSGLMQGMSGIGDSSLGGGVSANASMAQALQAIKHETAIHAAMGTKALAEWNAALTRFFAQDPRSLPAKATEIPRGGGTITSAMIGQAAEVGIKAAKATAGDTYQVKVEVAGTVKAERELVAAIVEGIKEAQKSQPRALLPAGRRG